MKKLKILKDFYDKNTNELYRKNMLKDFNDKRADEVLNNKNNLAELISTSQSSKTSKRKNKKEVCDDE